MVVVAVVVGSVVVDVVVGAVVVVVVGASVMVLVVVVVGGSGVVLVVVGADVDVVVVVVGTVVVDVPGSRSSFGLHFPCPSGSIPFSSSQTHLYSKSEPRLHTLVSTHCSSRPPCSSSGPQRLPRTLTHWARVSSQSWCKGNSHSHALLVSAAASGQVRNWYSLQGTVAGSQAVPCDGAQWRSSGER